MEVPPSSNHKLSFFFEVPNITFLHPVVSHRTLSSFCYSVFPPEAGAYRAEMSGMRSSHTDKHTQWTEPGTCLDLSEETSPGGCHWIAVCSHYTLNHKKNINIIINAYIHIAGTEYTLTQLVSSVVLQY